MQTINRAVKSQTDIFKESEGDAYFIRNSKNQPESIVPDVISKYLKSNSKMLEIGCSSGRHLDSICTKSNCIAYGIDPSQMAIEEGRKTHRNITFTIGTSDNLQFNDVTFDMVYFGFSMYLIDRTLLLKSVSEADRVLKDGGYLVIRDFSTAFPTYNNYKHMVGVKTYKMDYPRLFLSAPWYRLIERHFEPTLERDNVVIDVLKKDFENSYVFEDMVSRCNH